MEKLLKLDPSNTELLAQKQQTLKEKISATKDKLTSTGKTLTTHVTAPIVALGMVAGKTTADFDAQMSKVQAISGATGDDFTGSISFMRLPGFYYSCADGRKKEVFWKSVRDVLT